MNQNENAPLWGVFCCVNFEKELGNGTVRVTGRLSQSFSVIAPLLTLWMIGGSWKSANKKNRKDSSFRKMSFRGGGKNAL
ncbi:hypothetical protein [Dialister invisus]|uniref:hypothetical protein n=1 Tax=Dialister invisus TaxID=218538 RepID=UPI0026758D7B|nr:hypothetical protein [Dialister invisus]